MRLHLFFLGFHLKVGYNCHREDMHMDSKTFKIIDSYGKELEYEILLAFKWFQTGNNYLVYTDNTNDEDGNLNIYAAIYYPDDDSKLDSIETEEEWNEIESRLKFMESE